MIMTRFFNEKLEGLNVCKVHASPAKRIKTDFSVLDGKKWKVHSLSRGKEVKIVFTSGDETRNLLLNHFRGGNWAYAKTFEELPTHFNFEKDHRFSLWMEDGSVMVHYDRFHQSNWRWKDFNADPYIMRSPDIVFEHNEYRAYMYKMRNHKYFNEPIYKVMLHQKYFNGFNNIIRCEVLARTRFSPFTSLREVLDTEIFREDLFDLSKYVIEELYHAGGAQMGIWVNPYGCNKQALSRFLLVYHSWKPHFWFKDGERAMYVHNRWLSEFKARGLKLTEEESKPLQILDGSDVQNDI
jgi:formamidopyrimidine-DNA glycosylase